MKHGISSEPHAKVCYKRVMRSSHKQFQVDETGLHVNKEKPFIAASPDLIVSCKCCGKGVCEIKCPLSCKSEQPNADNYSHLCIVNETLSLKRSSEYYFQVMCQMACTSTHYCDFFVYSPFGYFLERIKFDCEEWVRIAQKVEQFWLNQVGPCLLEGYTEFRNKDNSTDHCYGKRSADNISASDKVQKPKGTKGVLTKKCIRLMYICNICQEECVDEPKTHSETSIECSVCKSWVHSNCTNIMPGNLPLDNERWKCDNCSF